MFLLLRLGAYSYSTLLTLLLGSMSTKRVRETERLGAGARE